MSKYHTKNEYHKYIYFLFSQCIYEIKYNGISLYIRLRLFCHFRAYSNYKQIMSRKCCRCFRISHKCNRQILVLLVLEIEQCPLNWGSIFCICNYLRLGSLLRYGSLFIVIKLAFSPPAMLDGEEKLSQGREANIIFAFGF